MVLPIHGLIKHAAVALHAVETVRRFARHAQRLLVSGGHVGGRVVVFLRQINLESMYIGGLWCVKILSKK